MKNSSSTASLVRILLLIVLAGFVLTALMTCDSTSRRKNTVPRDATTDAGHVACQTLAWLDDAHDFIDNDRAALAAYFAFGRCVALQYGTTVTVFQDNGRIVKINYKGEHYYTVRNAVFP